MGIANSTVSSSSATILSNAGRTSVTNTIFLSTAPTSIVAEVHTAEVISTWDSDPPAERSSTTVIVPTEAEHTELQNGIISRRDEADDQRVSAPTQYISLLVSLTKRDRQKDKPNNESPAIQRARQRLKGVTPPHISLPGRRHGNEILDPGHRQHHIYHMIPVNDPPQYVKEDTSHSTLQLTRKHHLNTFPARVSTAQQASLETDSSFMDVVVSSDGYTMPFDDEVDVPPETDSTELKRRSTPPEEPPDANPSEESTAPQNAASMQGTANLPLAPSETIPHITAEQVTQSQDEIPALHKPTHRVRPQRNSAVPLEIPLAPKRNSAIPQDRPSTSARKKRDLAPAQQVLVPPTSQQPPLTKQRRRQKSPQEREGQIAPASWTVAHPPPKETERSKWTVSNPPPREKEGGTYSFANPLPSNGRERMRLSHYPMRKIQLFGRRRGGNIGTEAGGKEVD